MMSFKLAIELSLNFLFSNSFRDLGVSGRVFINDEATGKIRQVSNASTIIVSFLFIHFDGNFYK